MIKENKFILKYMLYIIFLIGILVIGLYWFSDYQYKQVNVSNENELTSYSKIKIIKEETNFVNISAIDKDGLHVKFTLPKSSPLYEKVFVINSNSSTFFKEDNILKLIILFFFLIIVTFIVFKNNFKSNRVNNIEKSQKIKTQATRIDKSENFEISHSDVTLNDIADYDYVKQELQEILDQLKDPEKYEKLGAILHGPPGTGKTFFAKAIAGEAGVPFISANGPDFVNEYVGHGAKTVRELFTLAKQNAPCIIFIDEIDALASERSGDSNTKEYDNTVNALLVELQGFKSEDHIVVIGATNKLDQLDKALIRPGRIDRKIEIGLPDQNARCKILAHLTTLNNRKFSKKCDFNALSSLTYNFSAAELESLVNEAILLTARKNENEVSDQTCLEAFDKVSLGIKSSKTLNKEDKEIVAYHEAGHAVMSLFLKPKDKIQKVTILPYGNSLGFVQKTSNADSYLQSKDNLIKEVCILLAGRVAEEIFCGNITSGAENDLKVATNIVKHMIFHYGMFDNLAYNENEINYTLINSELKKHYASVKSLIEKELNNKVSNIAKNLLDKEVLNGKELASLFNKKEKTED
jgi:cell division protease FtsH